MSATFDPSLGTKKDWVRLLTGDTDTSNAKLQDETIEAILTKAIEQGASEAGAPYCAAAQAGEMIAARWTVKDEAAIEKVVSKLRIRKSEGEGPLSVYRAHLADLRAKCTHLSLSRPSLIKSM